MRVGTVAYCSRQGIGWIPKWYYDHGVITDVVLLHHSKRRNYTEWYPEGTPIVASRPFEMHQSFRDMVARVDLMLFIETPFDWDAIRYCQSRGVRTVIMPMYECTPVKRPHEPDLWLCPSLLDMEYFSQGKFVPVPVEYPWRHRSRARRFLHNGGHLGLRGHKGTLEILKAMEFVKSPIELKVTSQDKPGLERILDQVPETYGDDRIFIDYSDIPHENLYDGYDVFIMAEKYNGLSLPPAEARAAGLLVVTSDRFPLNSWLPRHPLIPVSSYQKARVGGGYMEYDEAIVTPEDIAATIDQIYDSDISEYSLSALDWAKGMSWEVLKPQIMEALQGVL